MKRIIYCFVLLALFLAGASDFLLKNPARWAKKNATPVVLADDDEDEERDENDDEASSAASSNSSKPKTETTYVKLPDQIIKRLIVNTIYDSDGDGIFDPDDSTPNIHDIFIAKDENFNGIVDTYEIEE